MGGRLPPQLLLVLPLLVLPLLVLPLLLLLLLRYLPWWRQRMDGKTCPLPGE